MVNPVIPAPALPAGDVYQSAFQKISNAAAHALSRFAEAIREWICNTAMFAACWDRSIYRHAQRLTAPHLGIVERVSIAAHLATLSQQGLDLERVVTWALRLIAPDSDGKRREWILNAVATLVKESNKYESENACNEAIYAFQKAVERFMGTFVNESGKPKFLLNPERLISLIERLITPETTKEEFVAVVTALQQLAADGVNPEKVIDVTIDLLPRFNARPISDLLREVALPVAIGIYDHEYVEQMIAQLSQYTARMPDDTYREKIRKALCWCFASELQPSETIPANIIRALKALLRKQQDMEQIHAVVRESLPHLSRQIDVWGIELVTVWTMFFGGGKKMTPKTIVDFFNHSSRILLPFARTDRSVNIGKILLELSQLSTEELAKTADVMERIHRTVREAGWDLQTVVEGVLRLIRQREPAEIKEIFSEFSGLRDFEELNGFSQKVHQWTTLFEVIARCRGAAIKSVTERLRVLLRGADEKIPGWSGDDIIDQLKKCTDIDSELLVTILGAAQTFSRFLFRDIIKRKCWVTIIPDPAVVRDRVIELTTELANYRANHLTDTLIRAKLALEFAAENTRIEPLSCLNAIALSVWLVGDPNSHLRIVIDKIESLCRRTICMDAGRAWALLGEVGKSVKPRLHLDEGLAQMDMFLSLALSVISPDIPVNLREETVMALSAIPADRRMDVARAGSLLMQMNPTTYERKPAQLLRLLSELQEEHDVPIDYLAYMVLWQLEIKNDYIPEERREVKETIGSYIRLVKAKWLLSGSQTVDSLRIHLLRMDSAHLHLQVQLLENWQKSMPIRSTVQLSVRLVLNRVLPERIAPVVEAVHARLRPGMSLQASDRLIQQVIDEMEAADPV